MNPFARVSNYEELNIIGTGEKIKFKSNHSIIIICIKLIFIPSKIDLNP